MDQRFLRTLEEIELADEPALDGNGKVFDLFLRIGRMDEETVIAAYHTYRFFCQENRERFSRADIDRNGHIHGALIKRMLALIAVAPKERQRGLGLKFQASAHSYTREIFDDFLKKVER